MSNVLLVIGTVAALFTVTLSYLALTQSNEAAFRQAQTQKLASLQSQRRRVETIGELVADSGGEGFIDFEIVVRARSKLPQAMVGYQDKFPSCLSMATTSPDLRARVVKATMEVQRELSILAAAEQALTDREPPMPLARRFLRWLWIPSHFRGAGAESSTSTDVPASPSEEASDASEGA